MTDIIEGEVVGTELVEYVPPQPPATLFGTDDPAAVVEAARRAAAPLAAAVRAQKLSVKIGPSEHVRVEGWTLLGSMLGVFPICVWTHQIKQDGKQHGWEARVEARTRDGALVGAAEAQCTRDENQWSWQPTGKDGRKLPARDDYALRSMAQTRATSKALRQPLGFVMQLAGYNPTPAEEMPRDLPRERPAPAAKPDSKDATFVGASDAQKKKLDVLVGQLRDSGTLYTQHLYQAVENLRTKGLSDAADVGTGLLPEADPDGTLHWGPLRDTLSKDEASNLIERLSRLQEAAA